MNSAPNSSDPTPPLWRSLEEYTRTESTPVTRHDEFFVGASEWPAALDRREFIRLVGASLTVAGLSGCTRRALENIVPRTANPETAAFALEDSQSFATAIDCEGYARGILVTTQAGRPTKIEGNPDHPESLGATDVFTQAAILSLYDPDRSRSPRRAGQPETWATFESDWRDQRRELVNRRGAGLILLTEPTTSPTLRREIHRLLDAYPEAQWFQHTPLARYDFHGVQPAYDFASADVILTIESDCFYQHPAGVRYGRAFASRRRTMDGRTGAPRFYAIEASPSVTGALADFRLPLTPARGRTILDAVASSLDELAPKPILSATEQRFVTALVLDIHTHAGRVVCVAGATCEPDVQKWAMEFNRQFGASVVKQTVACRSDNDPRCAGDLAAMVLTLERGNSSAVIILGSNPVYTSAQELSFGAQLARVPFIVHLGEHFDETAAVARWHFPQAHFLEAWSDLRGYEGTATIQQPLIEPMYGGRSPAEMLRLLGNTPGANSYDLVRETWQLAAEGQNFETRWSAWLAHGVIDIEDSRPSPPIVLNEDFPVLAPQNSSEAITLLFQPDPNVLDGRHSNNAWLQELPKPLTHLVWENAGLVSPQLALKLGLANGDLAECIVAGKTVQVPIWIMPGQAPETVTVSLGYGRTRAGAIGNALGYNAYSLRSSSDPWHQEGVVVRKPGQRHSLVTSQEHFTMEGRDLVRVVAPMDASRARTERPAADSLFPAWRKDRYAWGMSIDLNTCLGCNACIAACQAENNIPVVGKDQVARGREMHWLRVDRYYSGDPDNPRFFQQPVPCMHCENAPCEVVCPVAATVHSSEGLNDMIYNRCVGTRYCSNNCPYKVRRFNFLDYRGSRDSPQHFQANPNVTVRERGVMEKCTYCVQRINAARITAEKEHRSIRDGEIRTACQQACPAEAIIFGDLNDATSRVSRRKAEPSDYALLEELNTRPRTTYLAAVRHPVLT